MTESVAQWTMENEQWTMNNGQWTMNSWSSERKPSLLEVSRVVKGVGRSSTKER
ncbi:MAG: hypothetical protein K6F20_00885 [Bacteroidaceae bacterium]|nr:hypothetical protein [Bacteroidaceae bacterium]